MEYAKIIAITGLPGLYELISSKTDGGIVRSLEDKSTRFVSSRVHQFSHLESIEVYTTRYNVNLVTVLQAMGESKEALPDEKNNAALQAYFEKVYPELDHSRVYSSDLKKMVKWYSILRENDVEIKLSEKASEEAGSETEEAAPETEEAASETETAVKPAKEKKPTPKAKIPEVAEAPAKKSPIKKPAEPAEKAAPAKKTAAKATVSEEPKKVPAKKAAAPKKKEEKPARKSGSAAKKPAGKKS